MSEELLEQVKIALKAPEFVSAIKSVSEEKLNAVVLAEQVKIGSLIRCADLLGKLRTEMQERIEEHTRLSDKLKKDAQILVARQEERRAEMEALKNGQKNLLEKSRQLIGLVRLRAEDKALSNFIAQSELPTLKRVSLLQRSLIFPGGDSEFIALRIDQNERLLAQIQDHLQLDAS